MNWFRCVNECYDRFGDNSAELTDEGRAFTSRIGGRPRNRLYSPLNRGAFVTNFESCAGGIETVFSMRKPVQIVQRGCHQIPSGRRALARSNADDWFRVSCDYTDSDGHNNLAGDTYLFQPSGE